MGTRETSNSAKLYYRDLDKGEETAACDLVLKKFDEFIAYGYDETGREEFRKFVDPEAMHERLKHGNFVILALNESSIVGLIEVRSFNHVSLLFVDEGWHRRGVARRLLEIAIERCKLNNSDIKVIDVHSSPFAVLVYERLGFVKSSEEKLENGIRYTPMILKIK